MVIFHRFLSGRLRFGLFASQILRKNETSKMNRLIFPIFVGRHCGGSTGTFVRDAQASIHQKWVGVLSCLWFQNDPSFWSTSNSSYLSNSSDVPMLIFSIPIQFPPHWDREISTVLSWSTSIKIPGMATLIFTEVTRTHWSNVPCRWSRCKHMSKLNCILCSV